MRLADCGEASQSLYSVNRVEVTVSARARCSRRVSEGRSSVLTCFSTGLVKKSKLSMRKSRR